MGKYNVIPTIIAAKNEQRAQDEQNYINERRRVEDPRKDRRESDIEAARGANIAKYGIQAADPTSYGQLEGIAQRAELHPAEVEQAGLRTTAMRTANDSAAFNLDEAQQESVRAGMGRFYQAVQQSGADTPEAAKAWLANQTPESLTRIIGQPTDPAKAVQLIDQLAGAGDFQSSLRAARAAVGTPERYKQIVSGLGPDGKPVNMAISEDQAPGALSVSPDDRMHGLEVEQARANIDATRALSNQRNRPPGAKGDDLTPEQQQARVDDLLFSIGDMKATLDQASAAGAITNEEGDLVSNLFSGDNPAGRFIGGMTGDPKEGLRTIIDNKTTSLLNALIHMDGSTSSRLFDSNAEKEMWRASLGSGGSYQARMKAVEDFERLVRARMSDPRRAGRPPLTDGQAPAPQVQSAPVAGGNLQQRQDGVYVWTPGTD